MCVFLLAAPAKTRKWSRLVGLIVFALVMSGPGCGGGGGGGGSGSGTGNPGTPSGAYTITVLARSGGDLHAAQFTLNVQ
jgi:hypothetical protein